MDTKVDLTKFKKIFMLFNRHSGKQLFTQKGAAIQKAKQLIMERFGPEVVELVEIERFNQIEAIAQRVKEEQVDWVIIAGGDGTIRATIEKLVNLNYYPYISIYPAGTVNLVAKELQLPSAPTKWFSMVTKGPALPVYFARANGNVFLTVAGIGFDSLVVDNVSERQKMVLSKLAYVFESSELMRRELLFNDWKYRFQVRFDDDKEWVEGTSVIVGKSRYYAGRYNLFEEAALDNPKLYVAVMTGAKKVDFLTYAANMCMETLCDNKDVIVRECEKLSLRCNVEHFAVELDGDAITEAPLEIAMEEKPLLFLA